MKKIQQLTQSKQVNQVVILYASTLIGVAIGVLNSVINTRALSPELYGDYRYVQNIIAFVSSLLVLGYFTSGSRLLAISKDEGHSRKIRGVMCVILCVTIAILMLVMTVMYLTNNKEAMNQLYLYSIPLCGSNLMLSYINTTAQGDNHIVRIAIARVIPSLLYCVIAYIIYKTFSATPGLMLLLYNGIAILVLLFVILSTHPSFVNLRDSFHELREENKAYGFNVYLGALMGVSTSYIAGITLGKFCDTNANVGFYTLALTIATPLSTLPAIIGTTQFKKFAVQNKISKNVFFGSVVLTFLSAIIFIALIKYIVSFLYDDSYAIVSIYASFLAISTCFHGLGDMINRFLGAHGQGRQIRNSAFICGFIKLIGSVVLVYYWHIWGAIVTALLGAISYFMALFIYYRLFINKKDHE